MSGDPFTRLLSRIEEIERALNNATRRVNDMVREGEILEVHEDGTYTAKFFGDESKSKRFPHPQQAGEISDWVPYSVGQRVMLISPSGDAARGFIIPGGYTDQFEQPHNQPGEALRKVGDSSDLMTGAKRRIVAGEIELVGNVRITGGALTHNGTNVGDTHKHGGVVAGASDTDNPK